MESANGFEIQNNSTYLIAYKWVRYDKGENGKINKSKDFHYAAFTTDSTGRVTPYNAGNIDSYNSFSDFATEQNMHWDLIFGRTSTY